MRRCDLGCHGLTPSVLTQAQMVEILAAASGSVNLWMPIG
jgi:hypothetical protein